MTVFLLITLFLGAVLLVGYTYVGYPLLIARYAGDHREQPAAAEHNFNVCVVISAFRAEQMIDARLDNLFASDYPAERLHIIVVNDGSPDGTAERLAAYADDDRVSVIEQSVNGGKARALNVGLAAASSEIVVMTDVRQKFEPDTIARLVSHFTDPGIGAVTGNLVFADEGSPDPQGGYWNIEKRIRESESRYRSTIGVTGAVYAARRELIDTLHDDLILDDVLIPMRIVRAGYRVKFDTSAIAYDRKSSSLKEEYDRKVRTLAGNWQLLALEPWLLSRSDNPVFFEFVSHKVFRLLAPWALVVTLICAWLLSDIPLFAFVFGLQMTLIVLAAVGAIAYLLRVKVPLVGALMAFGMLNVAALVGTWKFVTGRQKDLWRTH